jgi:hypothetical protein
MREAVIYFFLVPPPLRDPLKLLKVYVEVQSWWQTGVLCKERGGGLVSRAVSNMACMKYTTRKGSSLSGLPTRELPKKDKNRERSKGCCSDVPVHSSIERQGSN